MYFFVPAASLESEKRSKSPILASYFSSERACKSALNADCSPVPFAGRMLCCIEVAHMMRAAIGRNDSSPLAMMSTPVDTLESGKAARSSVHHVLAIVGSPQVSPTVVQSVAIDMVNLLRGLLTGHPFPYQPVGKIVFLAKRLIIDANHQVSLPYLGLTDGSGGFSCALVVESKSAAIIT